MHISYLDNSSTTVCCKEAADIAYEAMTVNYGNPSSLHKMGITAEEYLRDARDSVAKCIGAAADEVYFTSGGTEANNLLILGAVQALRKRGNRIITTSIEHPSVLNVFKYLEKEGFEVIYLQPDETGTVPKESVFSAVNEKTVLVSMMYVNNETGAYLPVNCVKKAIDTAKSPALFHCDAVQAFGKMPIKAKSLGVDLMSLSGHKIHASKGVGAAFIRKGVHISSSNYGGGQEKGIRNGTQATAQIASLGVAAKIAFEKLSENKKSVSELKERLKNALTSKKEIVVNSPDDSLEYILNFSVLGIRSEIMLHHLERLGVFVSAGSACSKGSRSHVLEAMHLTTGRIDSAIRVSFSRYNTSDDVDRLIGGIFSAIDSIRHI